MKLLSILIPTRNRSLELRSLIDSLINLIEVTHSQKKVEVIISNNSDSALENFNFEGISICKPESTCQTAEENLFFLLTRATGKYVWPLGDDDIPNLRSFIKLMEICEIGEIDAMTWNSRIIGIYGEMVGHSRVIAEEEMTSIEYSDFLCRMGFWSVPAAISLTIFKNELNNFGLLNEILALESPIYSHVTYYASIFKNRNFSFINEILVDYQTNRHDVLKKSKNHWQEFSKVQQNFFRYPWTLGMIRQLKYLESAGAIEKNYLAHALDISHFNKRFRLVDQMILMLFEQILLEISNKKIIKISRNELEEIIAYISVSEPRFARYFELFRRIKMYEKQSIPNQLYIEFESHQKIFAKSLERMPFHAYYRNYRFGFLIYETPLGWLGIQPNLEHVAMSEVDGKSKEYILMENLISTLTFALAGLKIPSNFIHHAKTEKDLVHILEESRRDLEINYIVFNSLRESTEFYGYSIHQNSTRARRVWNGLPLFLKRAIKRYFF